MGGGYDLTPITEQLLAAGLHRVHDRPAALPAGLPADPELYLYKASQGLTRHRRRRHRPEVPRQDDGRAVQLHQEPLRGHRYRAGRPEGLGCTEPASRFQRMAVDRQRRRRHDCLHPRARHAEPGPRRRRCRACCMRFLTLREGSIIVVTLVDVRVLRGDDQQLRHRAATSSRCCRTSPTWRSWPPGRCS